MSSKREEEDRVMMPEEKRRNSPSSFFPRPSVCQNRCLSNCSERRRRGGKKTEEESRPEEMANYPSTSSSPLSMHAHPCVCSCLHFHIFFVSRLPEHFFLHFRPTEKEARRQLDSFFYPPQPSSPFPFLTVFQSGFGRCIFFLFSRFLFFFFFFFFARTASVVWIFVQEVKRARRT